MRMPAGKEITEIACNKEYSHAEPLFPNCSMRKSPCKKQHAQCALPTAGTTTEYSHGMHACQHGAPHLHRAPGRARSPGPALATRVAAETAFNETCTLRHQSQHTQAARKHPMRVQRARALLQPTCCNLGCSIALLRSGPGQRCGCCRACPAQPLNVPGALHCVNFTG